MKFTPDLSRRNICLDISFYRTSPIRRLIGSCRCCFVVSAQTNSVIFWLRGSRMQSWVNQYPVAFVLAVLLFTWLAVSLVVSYTGGWYLLARNFRSDSTFKGLKWRGESGWMRGVAHYRNCLVVGASPEDLYLSVFFPFRVAHPPLFIPWNEVALSKSRIFFVNIVRFQLGRRHSIPFSIRESLAGKLKIAAGAAWPIESMR